MLAGRGKKDYGKEAEAVSRDRANRHAGADAKEWGYPKRWGTPCPSLGAA